MKKNNINITHNLFVLGSTYIDDHDDDDDDDDDDFWQSRFRRC